MDNLLNHITSFHTENLNLNVTQYIVLFFFKLIINLIWNLVARLACVIKVNLCSLLLLNFDWTIKIKLGNRGTYILIPYILDFHRLLYFWHISANVLQPSSTLGCILWFLEPTWNFVLFFFFFLQLSAGSLLSNKDIRLNMCIIFIFDCLLLFSVKWKVLNDFQGLTGCSKKKRKKNHPKK